MPVIQNKRVVTLSLDDVEKILREYAEQKLKLKHGAAFRPVFRAHELLAVEFVETTTEEGTAE